MHRFKFWLSKKIKKPYYISLVLSLALITGNDFLNRCGGLFCKLCCLEPDGLQAKHSVVVAAVPESGVPAGPLELVVPFEVTRKVRPALVPPLAQVAAVELNLKVDETSVPCDRKRVRLLKYFKFLFFLNYLTNLTIFLDLSILLISKNVNIISILTLVPDL